MVLGHGIAEAQGAGERLRLPHAYLRREISDGPEGDAEARRRPRRRLQAAAETDRRQSQRSGHAFADNRVTLDAIAQIGPTARGVAVVDATVTDTELKRLNDLGIRGIRFNLVQAGATTAEMIEPLSRRVNDLGWHIQIHMRGEQIAGIEDLLLRVSSPIVFDHLGRLAQPNALDNPGFKTISKLIDKGRTWVKLSGAYQDTKVGPPTYSDTVAVARAYIKAAPERMVWASDWPHPTEKDKPDDAVLFDLLAEWAPDEAIRTSILVQNPATLYGFPASP